MNQLSRQKFLERLDAATGAGTILRRDLLYTDRDLLKLTKHTLPSGGDLIDFHHYTHDALGRRTRTDIMGGMHWE